MKSSLMSLPLLSRPKIGFEAGGKSCTGNREVGATGGKFAGGAHCLCNCGVALGMVFCARQLRAEAKACASKQMR